MEITLKEMKGRKLYMYYVPDGTEQCGYYECKECGSRFLDLKIAPTLFPHTVEKRQIWR